MISFENLEVVGLEPAIRGMRNAMNSWAKSDTLFMDLGRDCEPIAHTLNDDFLDWPLEEFRETALKYDAIVGPNDKELTMKLALAGSVHAKYRRMIVVYVDITAPLYWWKEFDTYKVGTVANSCSTMHKIAAKEFTINDFSHEHLNGMSLKILGTIITNLNYDRGTYLVTNDKTDWWQMIQLLPSSYNQRRTVMISYEVLTNIYHSGRKDHKLDEWREFCKMIESLPESEIITGSETTQTIYVDNKPVMSISTNEGGEK